MPQVIGFITFLGVLFLACLSESTIMSDSSAYVESRAILYAKLSAITHCSDQQLQTWSCKLCKAYPHLVNVSVLANPGTHIAGFIGYDSSTKNIIIAWRGTDNTKNWLQDLDFKQMSYTSDPACKQCKVHQGFYKAYQSVAGKTYDKIKELLKINPAAEIIITGHSLGGALAQIAVVSLYRLFPNKIKSQYVYGCPRVGNANFARYFDSLLPSGLFRVVHYRDIVPHVPPHDFNFLHSAVEVFYDQTLTTYKVCNSSGEDPKCSDGLAPKYSFDDHTFYWVKTDSSVC